MKKEPKLNKKIFKDQGTDCQLTVFGGLCAMNMGNYAPYFTITAELWAYSVEKKRKLGRDCLSCGCMHETIIEHFPEYADIVALHLSTIDGVPIHCLENGWYWFGKSKYICERKNALLASHFRISLEDAEKLSFETKADLAVWIETQKPRWKQEAEDCIKKHNLQIF
jgi:hypothetical protein